MADGTLAERLMAGDKRALARAITLVESDDPAGWDLVREIYPHTGKAAIVGLTGAPGSGKSTLIGALTKLRREANRGALGGLSEAALQAALLMDAAGKDDVFLETVGVGQAEVDIIDHADTIVLVLMPGSGDSIQALKAGVMEIPDIIVVNKADHPLTDTMVREIKGVLTLAPQEGWHVPIVKTEAARGEGVDTLVEKLDAHRAYVEQEGTLSERRRRNLRNEVLGLATMRLRRALAATLEDDPEVAELLDAVVERRIDPASAASTILARGAIETREAAR